MRTTLDIDDDVLAAAKELGRIQNLSAGQMVSQLLRKALTGGIAPSAQTEPNSVAGFRPFSSGNTIITNDEVNRLREAEGI